MTEAAERLGLDDSRVRQLLRSSVLEGRHVGRAWLVSADSVSRLESISRPAGRPASPARAWGLLDLLDGRRAPWLSSVARSQVRKQARRLAGSSADRWRAALRARADRVPIDGHRAAIAKLIEGPRCLAGGVMKAVEAGADLVAVDAIPEVYVPSEEWDRIRARLQLERSATGISPAAVVRVPRGIWPFEGIDHVGAAALAADLLDSTEPRAVQAGVDMLNQLVKIRERV